jgi:hypothetical protein
MLRVWQVVEAYCPGSTHEAASALYRGREPFAQACRAVITDIEQLGARLHPVQFLRVPDGPWLFEDNGTGTLPFMQRCDILFKPIQEKHLRGAVSDVSQWGVDAEVDSKLNCKTRLWLL